MLEHLHQRLEPASQNAFGMFIELRVENEARPAAPNGYRRIHDPNK
jgi:hypothetical protein